MVASKKTIEQILDILEDFVETIYDRKKSRNNKGRDIFNLTTKLRKNVKGNISVRKTLWVLNKEAHRRWGERLGEKG